MTAIIKFIYYKILGWRVVGNTNFSQDSIKKAVIIGAPHTSWHDFFVGLYLRKVTKIKTNFIAKEELFKWPLNIYFKAIGGRALDRTSGQNKVEAIAKLFENEEEFRLTLAPEGTRKKVEEWRTGFYFIAKAASVPIIMFTFDFENKQNKISEPFYLTDNIDADMKFIRNFFKGVKGKIPENS